MPSAQKVTVMESRRLLLSGHIQGVGFRPFIYNLAKRYQLTGWVRNCIGVVEIQVQGLPDNLRTFICAVIDQAPSLACPRLDVCDVVPTSDLVGFSILDSSDAGDINIQVPADLSLCDDCLEEMNNSKNRRYRYPFINCTQCGPRYTMIQSMPYDRPNTTMAAFELCCECRVEYENPADSRFHAEPIACAVCGPSLEYRPFGGEVIIGNETALAACVEALYEGEIIAVKGIGGYHLMCDARNDATISRLRAKKPRPDKPLAVMFPAPYGDPLSRVTTSVTLTKAQARLLNSAARPIVLAPRRLDDGLGKLIAPGLSELGVMLPYSPLHHLLLNSFNGPLVATSANISGEPVLTEEGDVQARMADVVDGYLHHDRPIERPADDSVFRWIGGRNRPIRLGRGYAPLELELPFTLAQPVLALGGHMKNTVALGWADRVVVSPHIGDLGSIRSQDVLDSAVKDLQLLYKVKAEVVLCDAHPGYATTRYARELGLPLETIWHHKAHASSACGSSPGVDLWLAFTWDGVGYGEDGTLWGGEALLGRPGAWRRIASMRPFRLPGGERAGREPWRSAAALCWELGLEYAAVPIQAALLHSAWQQQANSPLTSSVGRLFDAAAAMTGVCSDASFEGQGPMYLEALAVGPGEVVALPLVRNSEGVWISDWAPLVPRLLDASVSKFNRAALLHASMAQVIVDQAVRIRDEEGVTQVSLSGGVFQNRVLTEMAMTVLEAEGFTVTLPMQIPINDGGLSFGQIIEFGLQGK